MCAADVTITYDLDIQALKDARGSDAVLKYDFLSLRQQIPDLRIFVFEGDEDKQVYRAWIGRIDQDMDYEPFVCNGKKKVLSLREILKKDRSGMISGVYFFVDRDYDDLQGYVQDNVTYITETYSVENFLVLPETIEKVLKDEFHCGGFPDQCSKLLSLYDSVLSSFLDASAEANQRIYVARRLGLEIQGSLPKSCTKICEVGLDAVNKSSVPTSEWITYSDEPSSHKVLELQQEFSSLDPVRRYRGKFLIGFLWKWFEKLAEEYRQTGSQWFNGVKRTSKVRVNEISLGLLASVSPIPSGLPGFVRATAAP